MNKRFSRGWLLAAVGLLAAGGAAWWWLRHPAANPEAEKDSAPTAPVRVAQLRRGAIERTLTAYGTVVAAPGGTRSVAFPFECRVVAVSANVGQSVAAGDALLQIEPSADARLALDTAQSAQDAADKTLRDVQTRFQAHLATNADLQAAQSAARDAALKLQSLRGRTPGADGTVKAPAAGLITRLPVAPGTVVPAGGPLVELAVENRFEARLGIAPADAAEVKAGQGAHLFAVQARGDGKDAPAAEGTVRVVGSSVDPATRMVDAFVALDASVHNSPPLLVGAYLRAGIVLEKKDALLAPRAAVLPAEGESGTATVFTVENDHAVKHAVTVGIDDGTNVEITNPAPLRDGTNVVTEGNYELEDKMIVEVTPPAADKDKPDAPAQGQTTTPAPLASGKETQGTKSAQAATSKDDRGDAHQKEDKTP